MALKLSPPWCIFYSSVAALFKYDPEVHVIYDEEAQVLSLYVDNDTKAEALTQIMPTEKQFGNVTVTIRIVPANGTTGEPIDNVYAAAFEGNGILEDIEEVTGIFATTITYVIFRKEVVQYFSDNLSDYYGNRSALYQDLAREVFVEDSHVFFCTSIVNPLEDQLVGETWP